MLARRAFLAAAPAVALAGPAYVRFPANAAEFNYRFALDWPAEHPLSLRVNEAAAGVLKDSNGRMDIKVYAQSLLGTPTAVMQQLRLGAIELYLTFLGYVEPLAQVAGLGQIPFAFAGHKEAVAAMDGPFGKYIKAATEKLNLHVFDVTWDGGFRQVSNWIKPILTPDDLKGMKIRVPSSPASIAVFKAFGASPTPVDPKDQYMAVQTHLVDGTELPVPTLYYQKMYEIQKYLSIINHSWTGEFILMNGDIWAKLPKNLQEIVAKNIDQQGMLERQDIIKMDTALETDIAAKGMIVSHPQIPLFKNVVRQSGLYVQWRNLYGTEGFTLLEKAVGKLT